MLVFLMFPRSPPAPALNRPARRVWQPRLRLGLSLRHQQPREPPITLLARNSKPTMTTTGTLSVRQWVRIYRFVCAYDRGIDTGWTGWGWGLLGANLSLRRI